MEKKYIELLKREEEDHRRFGMPLPLPCTENSLKNLRKRSLENLDCAIPEEFEDFLRMRNGLSLDNGTMQSQCRY
jgi:hypothetical protein